MKISLAACFVTQAAQAGDEPPPNIHVRAFDLPRYSDFLSTETRNGIERFDELFARARKLCDPSAKTTGPEIRACESLMYKPILAEARKLYDVEIESARIGGVQTDIVTPAGGVPQATRGRVLLNVHSGGFRYGARVGGQLEAMPIAALGKYRVIAVDYRMAPEHQFPAATLDVIAVYRELLKQYSASSIGLYGCSAGGRIVGQTLAWIAVHKLPRPAAAAIQCSPPSRFGGDSNTIAAALQGTAPLVRSFYDGYFKGVSPTDPLAFPGDSDAVMSQFPPVLLMTSTRDYSLSPMVQMHSRLVQLGVPTELHIFEGLRHGEFLNPYIPESRQAAAVLATFFDSRLTSSREQEEQLTKSRGH